MVVPGIQTLLWQDGLHRRFCMGLCGTVGGLPGPGAQGESPWVTPRLPRAWNRLRRAGPSEPAGGPAGRQCCQQISRLTFERTEAV